MKQKFYNEILEKLINPSKVKVCIMDNGIEAIMSKENTNDTVSWFKVNSEKLESYLSNNGKNWYYVFEKQSHDSPAFIYMFIGTNLQLEEIVKIMEEAKETANDKELSFSWDYSNFAFKDILPCQYEEPTSTLEEVLEGKAATVIEIL